MPFKYLHSQFLDNLMHLHHNVFLNAIFSVFYAIWIIFSSINCFRFEPSQIQV